MAELPSRPPAAPPRQGPPPGDHRHSEHLAPAALAHGLELKGGRTRVRETGSPPNTRDDLADRLPLWHAGDVPASWQGGSAPGTSGEAVAALVMPPATTPARA